MYFEFHLAGVSLLQLARDIRTITNDDDKTKPLSGFDPLYWVLNLKLDSNVIAHFNFYNSDNAKRFRVIIEGMDAKGRLRRLQEIVSGD
ncbi:MAG: hypothetical protein ABI261_07285 [Ginsengibacter sp.]